MTDGAPLAIQNRGFCALKYEGRKREETIRQRIQILKSPKSLELSLSCVLGVKNSEYYPIAPFSHISL